MSRTPAKMGFTIVELLVVIVVIGILAAITIAVYNGIQQRAVIATLGSDLDNSSKQLKLDQADLGVYPSSAAGANKGSGLKASQGTTYQYSFNNATAPQTFCVTATNRAISYFITQDSAPQSGGCPGDIVGGAVGTALVWTQQTALGVQNWSVMASSADGTKLIAASFNNGIYTSIDSGATWTARPGAGLSGWNRVYSSADGSSLLAINGGNDMMSRSTNGGASWTVGVGYNNWPSLAMSTDGVKIIAANYYDTGASTGDIYTSTVSGASWTLRTIPGVALGSYSVASSADGTKLVIANGNSGYIYTSVDSGASWATRSSAGARNWSAVASSSDGGKLIASNGTNGYLYSSSDSGVTWTERTSAGAKNWKSIVSSSDGTRLIAAVTNGYLYTSLDSGATWTQQTSAGSGAWMGLSSSADSKKLFALFPSGTGGYYFYTGVYQ